VSAEVDLDEVVANPRVLARTLRVLATPRDAVRSGALAARWNSSALADTDADSDADAGAHSARLVAAINDETRLSVTSGVHSSHGHADAALRAAAEAFVRTRRAELLEFLNTDESFA